jgi:Peptidase inhibitor family I36
VDEATGDDVTVCYQTREKATVVNQRLAAFGAALVLAIGGLVGMQAPAQAHAWCQNHFVCFHQGPNYTGPEVRYDVLGGTNSCTTLLSSTFNNNIESIYGNYVGTGRFIAYWNSHNCTGTVVFWSTGGAYPTLPTSARNTISSFMRCNGPC